MSTVTFTTSNFQIHFEPKDFAGKDYLFVAVKGLDGKLAINQGTLGKGFVGWQC